jgi:hypothetical protein
MEEWKLAPGMINFGSKWMRMVKFTLKPHYPQGKFHFLLDRWIVGPQIRYGHDGEDKNSYPSRKSNPDSLE